MCVLCIWSLEMGGERERGIDKVTYYSFGMCCI